MTGGGLGDLSEEIPSKPVLVFVVCRVRLYLDSLVMLLNRQDGISATGSVAVDESLIPILAATSPDTVLLDVSSPDALSFAAVLVRTAPGTRVLGFGIDEAPREVIACAEAGLCGYVPRSASMADLSHAARRVALGDTVCSAGIAEKLFLHLRRAALEGSDHPVETLLTERQLQVLELINQGLSNKQIAQRLSLGPSTVKNHVHGLLNRLQVGRRAEAATRFRHVRASIGAAEMEMTLSQPRAYRRTRAEAPEPHA